MQNPNSYRTLLIFIVKYMSMKTSKPCPFEFVLRKPQVSDFMLETTSPSQEVILFINRGRCCSKVPMMKKNCFMKN